MPPSQELANAKRPDLDSITRLLFESGLNHLNGIETGIGLDTAIVDAVWTGSLADAREFKRKQQTTNSDDRYIPFAFIAGKNGGDYDFGLYFDTTKIFSDDKLNARTESFVDFGTNTMCDLIANLTDYEIDSETVSRLRESLHGVIHNNHPGRNARPQPGIHISVTANNKKLRIVMNSMADDNNQVVYYHSGGQRVRSVMVYREGLDKLATKQANYRDTNKATILLPLSGNVVQSNVQAFNYGQVSSPSPMANKVIETQASSPNKYLEGSDPALYDTVREFVGFALPTTLNGLDSCLASDAGMTNVYAAVHSVVEAHDRLKQMAMKSRNQGDQTLMEDLRALFDEINQVKDRYADANTVKPEQTRDYYNQVGSHLLQPNLIELYTVQDRLNKITARIASNLNFTHNPVLFEPYQALGVNNVTPAGVILAGIGKNRSGSSKTAN